MPDAVEQVIRRARKDRSRALVGLGAVYVILVGTAAWKVPALLRASTRADIVEFVVGLLGSVAIVVAVHVTMRGTFTGTGAAPLEALAALERRHAGRLRLVRVICWIAACLVAASVARAVMMGGSLQPVVARVAEIVAILVVFLAFVRLRLLRVIDRDLRDVAEARRLLGEVGDEVSEGRA